MFCHIVRIAPAFWLRVQDPADLSFTPLPLLKVSRVLVRLDNVAWLSDQTHRELVYRPFQFQKRRQYVIGAHNETLPVAMRVNNPDCSPLRING
jgi:hypothetical protein